MEFDVGTSDSQLLCHSQNKKRRISTNSVDSCSSCEVLSEINASLPALRSSDYFMKPSLSELATRELIDPGYCSRVKDLIVGRLSYGYVKFIGETDVRWLDFNQIIKFSRHEVVVYEDESTKPVVGQGLNKAAERFGLTEDDEEDIIMGDATLEIRDPLEMSGGEVSDIDEEPVAADSTLLSHSLPAHLGLDPVRMKEMRMLMFPSEEEEVEDFNGSLSLQNRPLSKENSISPLQSSARKMVHRSSPTILRKTPLALLEYNPCNFDSSSPGTILMAQQNKGLPLKTTKLEGFKLDLRHETPVSGRHSCNIVDAALFMARSFRVGWGPNGTLVHTGAPVGSNGPQRGLSSVINVEKVAIDKVVRDESNKVREELIEFCFDSPLNLHKEINHETKEVEVVSFKIKLLKLVCTRSMLSEICRGHIGIIERHLEVPRLSSARVVLMHQVMIWELIKVLFSDTEMSGQLKPVGADNEEEMMNDRKEVSPEVDLKALPLIRRAEFSYWLQESVCHRVQEEVSSLSESNDLEHIFLLLTGRQLDAAVELAASRGDVRLACLLSQAGGSMANRSDIARQLDLWRNNGLDFNFIEKDRIRLYELLAGNIQGALHDIQELLDDGRAPYPVPVYIDEGPVEEAVNWNIGERLDLAYYLMLLCDSKESKFGYLKTMFSAYASTYDPLDYHMIWHQRAVLEAVGTFTSNDLHVRDMGFVSQLLCMGQCHWDIYVVIHMPHRDDFPYLQATLIREILFQYYEAWSTQELQRQFIEDLSVPSAWLHEAMDTLESKNDACRDFFGRLNKSLAVWGSRLPVDARVAYSRMAEEICNLLLSDSSEDSTRGVQLSCFDTVFTAPLPEDRRSFHLQNAVSLFTCYLSETVS
ncbi:similar to SUPPRESSOR OF AUXIN RESISTANCE 3 [Actinidia rufa]|uniref:Similar to SUPPRESSOR OF AUXIN RESISTANCE 3 n=1 Tax=Actinidia rufa TaxID=165716 RepID=A0A7J0FZA3_9ERIC|nr:similar to SUPPRESSOR OF AUXIN RESISTANCE 3 [Actinidia rufa]